MTINDVKRRENVAQMMNSFVSYFIFHGFFFMVFSCQNYIWIDATQYQYSFLVLVVFYSRFICEYIAQLKNKKVMRRMGKWLKPRLYLKIVEHGLLALSMVLIPFYLQPDPIVNIPAWILIILPCSSGLINLFMVKYEQTPCNATFQMTVKTVLVLRLLVSASIIIKQEASLDWDWSTAFWPYWCSFTIQAVLIIATVVIFLNTCSSFFKGEARMHDILGSLWGFLMATGFMLSTL